jgi:CRP-like cAMP-binding protein
MKIVDEGFLKDYQDVGGRIWNEYLAAWYWSMTTLTTVGYGDITPSSDGERAYTILAMVVGGGFYGYVVGTITSMVSNADLNASAYYDRMELIHAWLTHHKLPLPMKRTLRRYFKVYLSEKSALNEADIWHDLSPELQKDVGEYIIHEDIKANPLFDGLGIGTVVRLQAILQRVIVFAGRQITIAGEAGTAMYIMTAGSCELSHSSGHPHAIKLGAGQSFGEEILLGFAENYEYTVTVLERARLEMIVEDEFLNLFSSMPNVLERMRQNALDLNPAWGRQD